MKSGDIALTEMTPSEMNVRMYGETAVITGRSVIKAKVKSQGGQRRIALYRHGGETGQPLDGVTSQVTRIAEL